MKRSPMKRGPGPKRSTTPMAKRGPAKAKREARYKSYLSSAAWKRIRREALERAGHQCEGVVDYPLYAIREGTIHNRPAWSIRCPVTDTLTVHHLTYARFGGDELPEDLQVLCRAHHNYVSALEGRRIA